MRVTCALLAATVAVSMATALKRIPVRKNRDSPSSFRKNMKGVHVNKTGLKGANDMYWYGTVTVGTPALPFTVDFDTGSSNLFLQSSQCMACNRTGHRMYNHNKSSTYVANGESILLDYGSSWCKGFLSEDSMSMGDWKITGQTFAEATTLGQQFLDMDSDGLLGLGWIAISQNSVVPPFYNLIKQHREAEGVFAFYLPVSSKFEAGELVLGGIDKTHYTGSLYNVPLTAETYWKASMPSFSVDGSVTSTDQDFICDSGTTELVVPSGVFSSIASKMTGLQQSQEYGYTVPCDAKLPTLEFELGGHKWVLKPEDYTLGGVFGLPTNTCMLLIGGASLPFWILGDVFLRAVYTVFDMSNKQLRFGQAKK